MKFSSCQRYLFFSLKIVCSMNSRCQYQQVLEILFLKVIPFCICTKKKSPNNISANKMSNVHIVFYVCLCADESDDKDVDDKLKQQPTESSRRENTLVLRLTNKEQELQDCMVQFFWLFPYAISNTLCQTRSSIPHLVSFIILLKVNEPFGSKL